jgi:hypothetical protein
MRATLRACVRVHPRLCEVRSWTIANEHGSSPTYVNLSSPSTTPAHHCPHCPPHPSPPYTPAGSQARTRHLVLCLLIAFKFDHLPRVRFAVARSTPEIPAALQGGPAMPWLDAGPFRRASPARTKHIYTAQMRRRACAIVACRNFVICASQFSRSLWTFCRSCSAFAAVCMNLPAPPQSPRLHYSRMMLGCSGVGRIRSSGGC